MNILKQPRAVVICGPTGVGKTNAAIRLAQVFGGEIIGADSMQIYRKMDIGTAKPTPAERAAVPHHLIDIVDPDTPFDAKQYAALAYDAVCRLDKHRITPLVVGGTGLYIKSLIHGLFDSRPPDPDLRRRLRNTAREEGPGRLYERLRRCDPETARRLHPNDTYRVLRALEVYHSTGSPLSQYQQRHRFAARRIRVLKIGLRLERQALYDRIDRRVDAMMEQGLKAEVTSLLSAGYSADLKPMQAIGYRHMAAVIQGRLDAAEALRTFKRDTRRYAKRQLTWFGADDDIFWHAPDDLATIEGRIAAFLDHPKNVR